MTVILNYLLPHPKGHTRRTINPRISQHFVPLAPAGASRYLGVLDPQHEQAPVAGIRQQQSRPVLRKHGLRDGVGLLTVRDSFRERRATGGYD